MTRPLRPRRIELEDVLALIGAPSPLTAAKIQPRLDRNCREFIARSPFVCVATVNRAGEVDCSPRGDQPGFVEVLDDRTLAIPDRPGNRLAQSFRNLAEHPGIGLLFFVPGVTETLRVNGRAYFTDEPELLARMAVGGRTPRVATVVEVDEAYIHCGRALLRSRLWDPERHDLASGVPSIGTFCADALTANGLEQAPAAEVIDAEVADAYEQLY